MYRGAAAARICKVCLLGEVFARGSHSLKELQYKEPERMPNAFY
jgi:hypothetical protein